MKKVLELLCSVCCFSMLSGCSGNANTNATASTLIYQPEKLQHLTGT